MEVQSGLGRNSDGEADGDGMTLSPGPSASRHQHATPPDTLPDVRSLADALEAPPLVIDLQVPAPLPVSAPHRHCIGVLRGWRLLLLSVTASLTAMELATQTHVRAVVLFPASNLLPIPPNHPECRGQPRDVAPGGRRQPACLAGLCTHWPAGQGRAGGAAGEACRGSANLVSHATCTCISRLPAAACGVPLR